MEPTPTKHSLPFRAADFASLADALDYAARGETGYNFYTGRGELYAALTYKELRQRARVLAGRLLGLGLDRGERVALIAETTPEFLHFFFACQYAGLIPVPLPGSVNLGSHKAYVRQLRGLLGSSRAAIAMAPPDSLHSLREAACGLGLRFIGQPADFEELPGSDGALPSIDAQDVAYIQYTSGSTRFPRGVTITQRAVLSNLAGIIQRGVQIGPGDRCCSWLPFYHDMGLVGLVLVPAASQISVDYLGTREFAVRPRQWLALMTRTQATISFSPPFGYELCARRLRPGEAAKFDLSHWRVAGVGAEMIRSETLERFAEVLAPSGFHRRAFLACYGMAECSLAVSFAPLNKALRVDCVDGDHLSNFREAVPIAANPPGRSGRPRCFVNCGVPLPDFEVEIRGEDGLVLGERMAGVIHLRGPSVMSGYFESPGVTAETLTPDRWLNTGDVGYRIGESLVITGRAKDLIIINGRNIWPQDLEYLAEQQPEVRSGDALAFAVPCPNGADKTVMVVQCRETDPLKRADLVARITSMVRGELGIDCHVELVPIHTLPRTSSGKLSRSKARENYIECRGVPGVGQPGCGQPAEDVAPEAVA